VKLKRGELPPDIRRRLQEAALLPPKERSAEIDRIVSDAKTNYPNLYPRGTTNMKIRLLNVRLAFPALFEPKSVNGEGAPAYSAALILPPDHPQLKDLEAAIETVARAKWGAKTDGILTLMRKQDKTALHDGDLKMNYSGFAGNFYVSARSQTRPTVVDANKTPLTAADGKPYAGCYVNAVIELWAQDNTYGKRVNASLGGVQFARDGDSFGGGSGPADVDEFEDLGTDQDLV
jgi:hypothetical protein